MANNSIFCVKSVSYEWRNYLCIDRKCESPEGCFWINRIYKNKKLVFEKTEKSAADKKVEDLKKELMLWLRSK